MMPEHIMASGHGNRPLSLGSYDCRFTGLCFFNTSCEREFTLKKMIMSFVADVCHVWKPSGERVCEGVETRWKVMGRENQSRQTVYITWRGWETDGRIEEGGEVCREGLEAWTRERGKRGGIASQGVRPKVCKYLDGKHDEAYTEPARHRLFQRTMTVLNDHDWF